MGRVVSEVNLFIGRIERSYSINRQAKDARGLDIHVWCRGGSIELITTRYATPRVSFGESPARRGYPTPNYSAPYHTDAMCPTGYGHILSLVPYTAQGSIRRDLYHLQGAKSPYRIGNRWVPYGKNSVQGVLVVWIRGRFVRRKAVIRSIGVVASWLALD